MAVCAIFLLFPSFLSEIDSAFYASGGKSIKSHCTNHVPLCYTVLCMSLPGWAYAKGALDYDE